MTLGTLLAFLAVAALAYLTPGPDWFVVMRQAASSRRAGLAAAVGVQCGLVVHLAAAALGVAAVVLASATAFTVLKLVGAAYLVVLGIRALRDSVRHRPEGDLESAPVGATSVPLGRVWRQAFVANVLNPKAALFFVAALPQFLSTGAPLPVQVAVLGVLDILLGAVWWVGFVLGVERVRSVLGAARSQVMVDRIAGTALIGIGGALAFSGRRLPA